MNYFCENQSTVGNKMKCLCIGDSLALPRKGVLFSETWFYKCQQAFSDFIIFDNRSQWAQTTKALQSPNILEYYQPEIVVIHLGIVDCAPRRIFENFILNANAVIIKTVFKHLVWRFFNVRYKKFSIISEKQFENNVRDYLERCKNNNVKKVVIISICPPTTTFLQKNSAVKIAVEKYNSILEKITDKYEFAEYVCAIPNNDNKFFLDDGHHINNVGHDVIFKTIYSIFNSLLNSK